MKKSESFKVSMVLILLLLVSAVLILAASNKRAVTADTIKNAPELSHQGISSQREPELDPLGTLRSSQRASGSRGMSQSPLLDDAYGKLPLSFEVNQGQAPEEVKFLSRRHGYTLFLTSTEAVMDFPIGDLRLPIDKADRINELDQQDPPRQLAPLDFHQFTKVPGDLNRKSPIANRKSATIRMKLVGANPRAEVEGVDKLPGITNYFIGKDPKSWLTHIPQYSRVKYRDIYPGVDLDYYWNHQRLEYDFTVSPGVRPGIIKLAFEGAERLHLDKDGNLLISTCGRQLIQRKPQVYQIVDGTHRSVEGSYQLSGHQVSFRIGQYDTSRALIIDPSLESIAFLADSDPVFATDATAVRVDSQGNALVAGYTESPQFPGISGKPPNNFPPQIFLVKLNPAADTILFSTYLGETVPIASDFGLALDPADNAYITGSTQSADFPTTPGAFQTHLRGYNNAFVLKVSKDGDTVLYSTLLGGSASDRVHKIYADATGHAFVAGETSSSDFPTTVGAYQTTFGGNWDVFVTKLSPTGDSLAYSTLLGRSQLETLGGFAVDVNGNAYVTGYTQSSDFPVTPGALQTTALGNSFVTKINPSGAGLVYSTFFAVGGQAYATSGLAIDSAGNAVLPGRIGGTDYRVSKLDPTGSRVVMSVPSLPSSGVFLDKQDNIYLIAFSTVSIAGGGGGDSYQIVKLDSEARNARPFPLTELENHSLVKINDASLGPSDTTLYIVGVASSSPRRSPGSSGQTDYVAQNAFLARIDPPVTYQADMFVPIVLSSSGVNGSFYTSELTLVNQGSTEATLQFSYTAAIGSGSGTASDTLLPGRQRIVPDAITYLRGLGIPIPETGNQGGTLSVNFSGISSPDAAAVMVRTTTPVGDGQAGLAYSAISAGTSQFRIFKPIGGSITKTDLGMPPSHALTAPCYLPSLRQNSTDRSNVAVQNVGTEADGEISLRLTVLSGDPKSPGVVELPIQTLRPGGFRQFNSILSSSGLGREQGYVRVERVSGNAPYYAYGVINDQATSDGSFVTPVPELALAGETILIVPAVVETSAFDSDLVLTNWSSVAKKLNFSLGQSSIGGFPFLDTVFSVTLGPGEQTIIPSFVQWMRDQSITKVGPKGGDYVWPLYAVSDSGDLSGIFVGSRTTAAQAGGRVGVSYPALPYDQITGVDSQGGEVWIYGLQQNAQTRTNLAIVNSGAIDPDYGFASAGPDLLRIELFDGETGQKVATLDNVAVLPGEWRQFNSILAQYAPGTTQGYARIVRGGDRTPFITGGRNPFIVYAVINDGAQPGQRTGDGSFVYGSH